MITAFLTGTLTKAFASFIEARQEKSRHAIEQESAENEHRRKLEMQEQVYRLNLDIERERSTQREMEVLIAKIDSIKESQKEIQESDRILYTKTDKFVINTISLMKPIITYCFLAIIFGIAIWGSVTRDYENYVLVLRNLDQIGIIGLAETSIAFWFGYVGVDRAGRHSIGQKK